ncbi:6TM ABC transporter family protein [Streptomyces johnsoniae]|uniref:ABC transmembrane type-1 domain-containing protein n=1 Tax=Streptomyces johnsoniae TaxID=3075532 RepID=A0ABU2SBD0_9ACTN|nr:hypothetical protein [Streptomyces sp. DSM 41886]MDT0446282.1 hypothetical protein [Streptomyces sp. DSM 41886]
MANALLPRLADGTAAALARLAPPTGLAVLGLLVFADEGPDSSAVRWTAALAVLALACRLLVPSVPRIGRPEAPETAAAGCVAVAGLLWADPALAACATVPLLIGGVTAWHAAGLHTRGAARANAVMVHVTRGIVHTARSLPVIRSSGRTGIVRLQQLAMVDRFHDVFFAQTRRMVPRAWITEGAFSPLTLITVVLVAGAALDTPGERVLACALFAPLAGACAAKLSESARGAPGTPDRQERAVGSRRGDGQVLPRARAVTGPLTSGPLGRMSACAAVTVLTEVAALVPAAAGLSRLLDGDGAAARPWLWALAALVVVHLVSLRLTLGIYQSTGVGIARLLSHRFLDRLLAGPEIRPDEARVTALSRVGTVDVVATSGLFVHHLRSMVGAVLMPVAAIGALLFLDWRIALAALCLAPSAGPALRALRTDPRAVRRRRLVPGLAQAAGTAVLCCGAGLVLADASDPAGLLAAAAFGLWCADPVARSAAACRGLRVPLESAERLLGFLSGPGLAAGPGTADEENNSAYDRDIPTNDRSRK